MRRAAKTEQNDGTLPIRSQLGVASRHMDDPRVPLGSARARPRGFVARPNASGFRCELLCGGNRRPAKASSTKVEGFSRGLEP
jgi:hypothetical protein